MPRIIPILFLILFSCNLKNDSLPNSAFAPKTDDRIAIAEYFFLEKIKKELSAMEVDFNNFDLFIRAFKGEKILEYWVKNRRSYTFKKYKQVPFCTASGTLGPKRKQGDRQVPEGVYYIRHFNPKSKFFLSLGINYPNSSDKMLATSNDPGGDIYIHGDCQSIGCIAINNERIKELYVLANLAKNSGQKRISVHIFPMQMKTENLREYQSYFPKNKEFWAQLKLIYQFFEEKRELPSIRIDSKGNYVIE